MSALAGLVKPLEWIDRGAVMAAEAPLFGSIRLENYGGRTWAVVWSVPGYCDTLVPGDFQSAAAAMKAAQDHYEARILSALNLPMLTALSEDASKAAELAGEVERLTAENADLKSSVVAFGAPWAVQYAKDRGLPEGHLHPTHYDILAHAGARMAHFTRAALDAKP